MYKVFDNYPDEVSLDQALRITMENIKTFLCKVAPVKPIDPIEDIDTPIPSSEGIPEYISDNTPIAFYSDVKDNTNQDFILRYTNKFKISWLNYLDFPVYCIFYSWMPAPIIIFVTNNFHWSSISGESRCIQEYGKAYDQFVKRPHICIAFDIYAFNVDVKGLPFYEDYTYGERFYYRVNGSNEVEDRGNIGDRSYEKSTCNVCPMLIIDPFYHDAGDNQVVSDKSVTLTKIKGYNFGMSLHNKVITFYNIFNTKRGTSYVRTSFISPLSEHVVTGCDIKFSNKSLLCKSDGIAYLSVYASGRNHNLDSNDRSVFVNVFGHTVIIGDPHSFVTEKPHLVILGACADYNIEYGVRNLYHDSYTVNWNSYRNVSAYCNAFKRPLVVAGKRYVADDVDGKYIGNFKLITGWKVPTIITSFQPSFFGVEDLDLDVFNLPHFPTLTNGSVEYSHNYALLRSEALNGDPVVFTYGFPTQTSNTLNNHFIAYPMHIYIKREPLVMNTYSLYCTLEFMLSCQRLYDGDARLHEYNYLDKKFIGISNRYDCLLYLVDEQKELVI